MFKIAHWFNNYQAPAVLMIDDLSDAYIDIYSESYKNDWGHLGNQEGSAYHFLQQNLLNLYPEIKITFFAPYLRHAILNETSVHPIKKYALGEREEYSQFLQYLISENHEIAHHGSNHGQYVNQNICDVGKNWIHEWGVFKTVSEGVEVTRKGIDLFKEIIDIEILGGKYCGYHTLDNSQEIIDKCNFLYWCEKVNYLSNNPNTNEFGDNNILSFPTNVAGNSFNRLTYLTGDIDRDRKKRFLKYFQPIYNLLSYYSIYRLYKNGEIISIQEHISPSTTWGTVQSSNIITDIKSLNTLFTFLHSLSIWYATCAEIATYIYVKKNTILQWDTKELNVKFMNRKKLSNTVISITAKEPFTLQQSTLTYHSHTVNNMQTLSVPIINGNNLFSYSFHEQ